MNHAKRFPAFALFLVFVASAFVLSTASAEPPAKQASDVELVAEVKGLHCGGCANRLDKVLARLDHVSSSKSSVETGKVELLCNPKIDHAVLRKTITDAGFTLLTIGPAAPKKVN
ncbi:MAG: copper chaperone CopZ [Myxococcota bacterium]|jgi:copper chaperone CopZ